MTLVVRMSSIVVIFFFFVRKTREHAGSIVLINRFKKAEIIHENKILIQKPNYYCNVGILNINRADKKGFQILKRVSLETVP